MQVRIVDGDGHLVEDFAAIRTHMPKDFVANTTVFADIFPPRSHLHTAQPIQTLPGAFRHTGPEEWLEFADQVGLEAAAIYPTFGLPFGFFVNYDWAIAACRAYNDWLYETYLSRSPRFIGMGMLPAIEPAAAAEELNRVVTGLGMAGGVLPATGLPEPLGAKRYNPIYAEADRLGCCLAIHGGNHLRIGLDHLNVFPPVNALGHPISQMIAFGSITFNGIFDRFPRARLGFLEAGVAWFLLVLERFDRAHETHVPLDPRGELLQLEEGESVSGYLRRHAAAGRYVLGCEGDEEAVGAVTQLLGRNVAFFSSDFPHETTAERCMHELKEIEERQDLDAEAKELLLWRNSATFYNLQEEQV